MSYYTLDPVVNGQRKQQVVKVGDTLPTGAIIGFDTTQTIPDGWEYYAENQIKKIAPVTPANGNISNQYGTSQTDTYSQDYINKFTDYSTTEQVVGKWTNGKPIYRKVIDSTTFTTDYYYVGANIENFVNQWGWVQRKDYPKLWQYIPSRIGDPMSISFLATDTSQGVKIDWGSNWQSNYSTLFNKIVIVIEYTKSTD